MLSAEVVTADGELVRASAVENPDLFWALRGGGGSFGIVTSLTFRLYPAARVFSGMSFYPAERAGAILRAYREWSADEPDGMNTAVLLMRLPPAPAIPEALRGRQVVAIRVFAVTDEATGRRQVAPLLEAAGPALVDAFAERPFAGASTATNGPDAPPMPHRQVVHLFEELDDDLLELLVAEGLAADAPYAFVELRHWGGAMAEPGPDAGPAGHRDTPYSVLAVAPYLTPDRTPVDHRGGPARPRPGTTGDRRVVPQPADRPGPTARRSRPPTTPGCARSSAAGTPTTCSGPPTTSRLPDQPRQRRRGNRDEHPHPDHRRHRPRRRPASSSSCSTAASGRGSWSATPGGCPSAG